MRVEKEERERQKDRQRNKEKKENDMPSGMLNQDAPRKFSKLVLPEPQISNQVRLFDLTL